MDVGIKDYKNKFYGVLIDLILLCYPDLEDDQNCLLPTLQRRIILFIYKFIWLNYTEHGLYYKSQNIKIKLKFPHFHPAIYKYFHRQDVNMYAKLTPAQHIFYIIKETES